MPDSPKLSVAPRYSIGPGGRIKDAWALPTAPEPAPAPRKICKQAGCGKPAATLVGTLVDGFFLNVQVERRGLMSDPLQCAAHQPLPCFACDALVYTTPSTGTHPARLRYKHRFPRGSSQLSSPADAVACPLHSCRFSGGCSAPPLAPASGGLCALHVRAACSFAVCEARRDYDARPADLWLADTKTAGYNLVVSHNEPLVWTACCAPVDPKAAVAGVPASCAAHRCAFSGGCAWPRAANSRSRMCARHVSDDGAIHIPVACDQPAETKETKAARVAAIGACAFAGCCVPAGFRERVGLSRSDWWLAPREVSRLASPACAVHTCRHCFARPILSSIRKHCAECTDAAHLEQWLRASRF